MRIDWLLLKSFFDPVFLIRVGTCSNNILLPASNIGLFVFALTHFMGKVLPGIAIGCLFSLLGLIVNPHLVFICSITSSSSHSRFGKVHDSKSIFLVLLPSFDSEVKPLLVSSCVGVYLHEKVESVALSE